MHRAIAESLARLPIRLLLRMVLLFALAACGWAQSNSFQNRPMLQQPIGQATNASGNLDDPTETQLRDERLLRALNADRQKALVSDTNKLLRLANELNAEIAGKQPDTFTPEQLHKMAEIEKLAHSVKDKMSTSVRGTPAFQPPFQPVHN